MTTNYWDANGYPLKSVSYDIDRNKLQRNSLKKIREVLEKDTDFPVDKLFSFTIFSGESQKYPDTWHYGCHFDEPSKGITIFFDSSYGEENILMFIKGFLRELLRERSVWGGYLFYQENNYTYPFGDAYISQNFYKENGDIWGN